MSKMQGYFVAIGCLGFITVLSGCASSKETAPPGQTQAPTSTSTVKSQTPSLITTSASTLNFTIADFPSGWQINQKGDKDGGYEVRIIKINEIAPAVLDKIVISWVKVFPDTAVASASYEADRKTKAETFHLDNASIGDESYIYSGNATFEVLSRHNNVLVRTQMFNQYGGSLDEVKQWAKKLDSKIK